MSHNTASRRDFLKRAAAFSMFGSAAPFALNLAGIGAASAATSDYKAIVCLFLYGGNDQTNTVIPYDQASYDAYFAARDSIAIPRNTLLEILPGNAPAGRQFALSTEMAALQGLFNGGQAAIVPNVGPLLAPTTLADFKAGRNLPPKLFSHNDQSSTWQAFKPEGSKLGWGGRIGDLLASQNTNRVFTGISASGNTVFVSGETTLQYQIGSGGATKIGGTLNTDYMFGTNKASDALKNVMTRSRSQLLENEHAIVTKRSIDAQVQVSAALASVPETDVRVALPTDLASDSLAKQLRVVARMAAVAPTLGVKRQVFFVSMGGFDTHDFQLQNQAKLHSSMARAIKYFYDATVALGIANNVTLFTASDFGRTLTSNGDGSDHGWGSHHFVVGGAVKGKAFYGDFPTVALKTNEDSGQGRLIPTTSVDQYAATLASWMGVSDADMPLVAPRIITGNFANRNLGFMA